ncbi:hypothetical protein D3C76_1084350 [compost metagenome]
MAAAGQREFKLVKGTYTLGDYSLQVIVNGQVMRTGADNDYVETDSRTITFNFDLDQDDVVVMRVNGGTSGPLLHEQHIASAGQTELDLAGSYEVGNNSLIVFINGAYQTINVDYLEDNPKKVIFTEPLEDGDMITLRVEGLPTVVNQYPNGVIISVYDNDNRIIREETTGDTHVIKEFEYGTDGKPSRMIIRDGGFVTTKLYTWTGDLCTQIEQTVKEGT